MLIFFFLYYKDNLELQLVELASDGSVAGEAGGELALPGGGVGQAGDLQQLMVAGYGHYVDGRGECPPVLESFLLQHGFMPCFHL